MHIDEYGFEIKRQFISPSTFETIIDEISSGNETYPKHGIRNADKKFKPIETLANSKKFIDLASSILGSTPQIVRVIFFDKTPTNNWLVSWHQDKTIAVNRNSDIPGWGPWSIKDNVHHVQPPLQVLEQMITFRLHLDDADENNGCLKVIPKSHRLGILSQKQINEITKQEDIHYCRVQAGDLVMMKPHILHASSKSTSV